MAVFSFTHKGIFVMGTVIKQTDGAFLWVAEAPELFPNYRTGAETMPGAVAVFRDGIDERIELRKKGEDNGVPHD